MKIKLSAIVMILILVFSCSDENTGNKVKAVYNLIKPSAGIYEVFAKNVDKDKIKGNFYEKQIFENNRLVKIERYNKKGDLTDGLFVPAITVFEYDKDGKVKFVRYLDKNGNAANTPQFGYSVIEYVYGPDGKVIMEIYRDKNFNLLNVPRDENGNIKNVDFISPVLVYLYNGNILKIKAFDKNFNLIKETEGDKPCIPFIDCGE